MVMGSLQTRIFNFCFSIEWGKIVTEKVKVFPIMEVMNKYLLLQILNWKQTFFW